MKKMYFKPQIAFESFELSTNIAGDCEVKTWTPSQGNCAYKVDAGAFGTINVFLDTIAACTTHPSDGAYDEICYDVPYGDNLFNS